MWVKKGARLAHGAIKVGLASDGRGLSEATINCLVHYGFCPGMVRRARATIGVPRVA